MNLSIILPEICLFVGAIAILMSDVFFAKRCKEFFFVSHLLSLLLCASSVALIFKGFNVEQAAFNNMYINNFFTTFVKAVMATLLTVVILFSLNFLYSVQKISAEVLALIIIATVGGMLLISANDFLVFYLAIELQALSLYLLAALNKKSSKSSESGLKYFILGSVASGILLFGISLIYGFSGTTNFTALSELYQTGQESIPLAVMFGFILVITAMFFKISAAPFHMWVPDVYEGSATIITTFFGTVVKFGVMLALIRLLSITMINWTELGKILVFVGLLSIIIGSLGAIAQKNLKRLLAYSSVSHVGFVLLALSFFHKEGTRDAVLYMVIYALISLGSFGFLNLMRSPKDNKEADDAENDKLFDISSLAGFSRTNPLMAFSLALLMLSSAGIPPLAGFFSKFYVIMAAFYAKHFIAALIALLFSVVSSYYYLRVIKVMYFDEPKKKPSMMIEDVNNIQLVVFFIAILNLVFVAFLNPILHLIESCL